MKRTYIVVYERVGFGWRAFIPELPGCIATAKTLSDAKVLIVQNLRALGGAAASGR